MLLLALLVAAGPASAQRDRVRAVTWQGVERRYVLHLPGDEVPERAPLVVVLGGIGQSLKELRTWLPIDPVAAQRGFIVVYSEAIERAIIRLHGIMDGLRAGRAGDALSR